MSAGRIAIHKRKSPAKSSYLIEDTNRRAIATDILPPEYPELARRLIISKAGNDKNNLLAMLGLTEGTDNV